MKLLKFMFLLFVLVDGVAVAADPWADSYYLESVGRYAEARTRLADKLRDPAPDEFALIRSAWLLHLQGNYAESAATYERALSINPQSIDAALGRMLPLMADYRWLDAIASGKKVLEEDPWNYTAQTRIMACEQAISGWAGLAARAAEVAERYPGDATVLVYWARAESALRNFDKARGVYARVLELVPAHAEAMAYLQATGRRK